MTAPHLPVLLNEVLSFFAPQKISTFVDGTLGAGGHAEAILSQHPEIKTYIGIDQDPSALAIAKERLAPWSSKLQLFHGNFSQIDTILQKASIEKVDGILVDLGVSSMQFDQSERGFSFMREGPLDMRMNPQEKISAYDIVNNFSEQELAKIFRDYGEEKKWRAAARAIVAAREKKTIETTLELAKVLQPLFPPWKRTGINPLTLIFQALRIAVNKELDVLESFLPKALKVLAPKGRLEVISFHSLEDRIVKNFMRYEADDKISTAGIGGVFLDKEPTINILTPKPVGPSEEEIERNPRSRSAKLRAFEKR